MTNEHTGKTLVSPIDLPKFNYSANAVSELKIMFPHDKELHSALDANNVVAWDIVMAKVKKLNGLFAALTESGFPVR